MIASHNNWSRWSWRCSYSRSWRCSYWRYWRCSCGGAAGVGDGGTGAGAVGVPGAAGPCGARTGGTGAAAGVEAGGTGARSIGVPIAAGLRGARTRGTRAAGAGGSTEFGYGDTRAGGAGRGGAGSGDTGRPLPRNRRYSQPPHCLLLLLTLNKPKVLHSVVSLFLVLPLLFALFALMDPESDLARAASPTVPLLLATVATHPSFESTAASALVTKLVDFASVCRLNYATALVADSEST
ncbi:unnamed protein product [Closterium sp. NIES-53]